MKLRNSNASKIGKIPLNGSPEELVNTLFVCQLRLIRSAKIASYEKINIPSKYILR